MSEPTDMVDVADRVALLLRGCGIETIVIGAVAMAAHRYVRFTEDIDLGVDADLPTLRTAADMLRAEGFSIDLHEPDATDPLGGVINVSGTFGLVQIVSFGDRFPAAIRDSLAEGGIPFAEGSHLLLAPLPQLVALKLYAGGTRSHADIVELLRRNPDADLEQIRETCRRYRLQGLDRLLEELD